MSDNKLTEIPKEIGKLVNLESVWIFSSLNDVVTNSCADRGLLFTLPLQHSFSCVTTRSSRCLPRWGT